MDSHILEPPHVNGAFKSVKSSVAGHLALPRQDATPEIDPKFFRRVDTLQIPTRAKTVFKNDDLTYLGDLCIKTEAELLRTPNYSKKTHSEVKMTLADLGVHPGMTIDGWPPENLDQLAARYEATGFIIENPEKISAVEI